MSSTVGDLTRPSLNKIIKFYWRSGLKPIILQYNYDCVFEENRIQNLIANGYAITPVDTTNKEIL